MNRKKINRRGRAAAGTKSKRTVWVAEAMERRLLLATNAVTVSALSSWTDTGIVVRSADQVTIRASAGWLPGPSGFCDADGNAKYIARAGYAFPGAAEGALIGRLGDSGSPFVIGKFLTIPAGAGGSNGEHLEVVINDDLDGRYGPGLVDNEGSAYIEVVITPRGAVAINDTSSTDDNITLYNDFATGMPAVQTIRAKITNVTSVDNARVDVWSASNAVTIEPSSLTLGAGGSGEVVITPHARSAVANDVNIVASINGQPLGDDHMTVVSVSFTPEHAKAPGLVYNTDTPPEMLDDGQYRIPPRTETNIATTVFPDLGSSGQVLTFTTDNQGDTLAGSVLLNGKGRADVTAGGVLKLVGGAEQTTRGHASMLHLKLQVRNEDTIMSNGFSVAAIPTTWFSGDANPIYDYKKQAVQGMQVSDGVGSDSGDPRDLDAVEIKELVEPKFASGVFHAPPPLDTSDWIEYPTFEQTTDTFALSVKWIEAATSFLGMMRGEWELSQVCVFRDARTGAGALGNVPVARSGYNIRWSLYTVGGWLFTDVDRVGATVSAYGVVSDAGLGNAAHVVQRVEAIASSAAGKSLDDVAGNSVGAAFDVRRIAAASAIQNGTLKVIVQPASKTLAGQPLSLKVTAEDSAGMVDSNFDGVVKVTDGDGDSLEGATTVAAIHGMADFAGLRITRGGHHRLLVTSPGLGEVSTDYFVVDVVASGLSVETPPGTRLTEGAKFTMAVSAKDLYGNTDTDFSGVVTIRLSNGVGSGGLSGTVSAGAVNGVATFSGLSIDTPASGYRLTANSSALGNVTSSEITVTPAGIATGLVVTSQPPGSVAAGGSFGLTVQAEDGLGNVDTHFQGVVEIADPAGTGSPLAQASAANGVATFEGLSFDLAGDYSLAISSGGLSGATARLVVSPLIASRLLVVEPTNAVPGAPVEVDVMALDANGNVDTNFVGSVALGLTGGPAGAVMDGGLTATAVRGIASFPGVSINSVGEAYAIRASSGGLEATSAAFAVTAGRLVVTAPPPDSVAVGNPFAFTVKVENGAGQVDTSFNGTLTAELIRYFGGGATLGGSLTATAVNGVATFSGLTLSGAGDYGIFVSGDGVGWDVTNPITATPVVAKQIVGTGGNDTIVLTKDGDNIDWSLNGGQTFRVPIHDVGGLTIDGNGGTDVVVMDYGGGDPLPTLFKLNGQFVLNGLPSSGDPLSGHTIDLAGGTLSISYAGANAAGLVRHYVENGYNGGAWDGTGDGITSSAAALDPVNYTLSYAERPGTTGGSVELRVVRRGNQRPGMPADLRMPGAGVVVPADAATWGNTVSGPMPPRPGHSFYVASTTAQGATVSQWASASAVTPNTVNDLVMNVSPFDTHYVACCEGAGGSAGVLTNGITQRQTAPAPSPGQPAAGDGLAGDASNNTDVISEAGGAYYMAYNLGTAGGAAANAGGYDLSEIDVITGHQDLRTEINGVDVLVKLVGSNQWMSLSGGRGFSLTAVPNGSGGATTVVGGSLQMAIVGAGGGLLAEHVRAVELVVRDPSTWFREFVVTGTPSAGSVVGNAPSAPTGVGAAVGESGVTIGWDLVAGASGYTVLRATSQGGAYAAVGSVVKESSFVDRGASPNTTYYYEVVASGNGDSTPSAPLAFTTPGFGATAFSYQSLLWQGSVGVVAGVPEIHLAGGPNALWSPLRAGFSAGAFSTLLTGTVHTNLSGAYTFVIGSDDDGYLWVDGRLASADAGAHFTRLATNNVPILLDADRSYNFVYLSNNRAGPWAMDLYWRQPQADGSVSPLELVPATNLGPTASAPPAPGSLTATALSDGAVQLSWNSSGDGSSYAYVVQRAPADAAGNATGSFAVVAQLFSGPTSANPVAANTWGVSGFLDTTVTGNGRYVYKVGVLLPGQTTPGIFSATSGLVTTPAPVSATVAGGTLNVGGIGAYDTVTLSPNAGNIVVTEGTVTVLRVAASSVGSLNASGLFGNGTLKLNGGLSFAGGVTISGLWDVNISAGLTAGAVSITAANSISLGGTIGFGSTGLYAPTIAVSGQVTAASINHSGSLNVLAGGGMSVGGLDGPGTLTVGGSSGAASNVSVAWLDQASLTVNATGRVTVVGAAGGTNSTVNALTIAPGGRVDLGASSLYVRYGAGADPLGAIKAYLTNGYNGGTWAGAGTPSAGVITSSGAANNALHNTGIAWVDSADGTGINPVANSILLKYAMIGDTDLDGTVGLSDYTAVVRNFGVGTNWDQGVVTYGATVGLSDYTAVVRNFGQVIPAVAPAGSATTTTTTIAAGAQRSDPPTAVMAASASASASADSGSVAPSVDLRRKGHAARRSGVRDR